MTNMRGGEIILYRRLKHYLIDSGIEFEIIGNKEDLEFLQKVNPPLYDKLLPHIIWKGKKHGSK